MHEPVRAWIRDQVAKARGTGLVMRRVLEIGSRNINGGIRDLLPFDAAYLGIDRVAGPGVDVVADAATWAPADGERFDCVVCCEVLEHATDPEAVVRHGVTLLEPGGVIWITAATPDRAPHSGVDGGPLHQEEHYRGVTAAEIMGWLESAGVTMSGAREYPDRGDVYAWAVRA